MRVTATIKRLGVCALIGGLLAVLGGAAVAGAAGSFTTISYSGQTGTVAIDPAVCTTTVFPQYAPWPASNEGRSLTVDASSAYVYARNVTSAVDRQWVTSRPLLVDRTTGAVVSGPWGDWALAADNSPVHWPTFTFSQANVSGWNINHVYATRFEVWWYNADGSYGKFVMQQNQYVQRLNYYGAVTDQIAPTCRMP